MVPDFAILDCWHGMLVVMGFYSSFFYGKMRRPVLFLLLLISCYLFFVTFDGFVHNDQIFAHAQSLNTGSSDQSWSVRSFIWNQRGNTWLRTHCTMRIGGLGSLVPGESSRSSCSNTSVDKKLGFVQYYHDIDPDDTTPNDDTDDVYGKLKGRAWSPFYGAVYFDLSDFPSSGNAASCYGLTGVSRQARVRRLSDEVKLVGCAYVPLLKNYILFNKFGTTDSSIPSSSWNGVSVSAVEDPVSAYLTLSGCAWSSRSGFWSVGPNRSSVLNNENCLPPGHNTALRRVLPESRIGSPGGVLTTVSPTRTSAKIGQEVGYQYVCPDGYSAPSLRVGSRIVSSILSFFRGSYREIFTDPVDTLLLTCTDRTGVFTTLRNSSGAVSTSVQNSLFISSFTATPPVLTGGGFISFGGQVSNQGGFASRTFIDTAVGHCDNTVRNGCLNGAVNDAVIADDSLYYKWRCEGVGGAAHSGTCQSVKVLSVPTQAKVVASDRAGDDTFGYSVSIDGDTAIVGAHLEDHDASGSTPKPDAGSAYIFTRTGSTWSQQAKIVASDRASYNYFGHSVSIDGDTAIVGAHADAGSAYIFTRTGSTWSQQAKIVASDKASDDTFGYSVSIDGDTAIVGAYNEDHDVSGGASQFSAGSAYIFTRTGSTWSQQAKIVASDRASTDYFGYSVSIDGDTAIVGAYNEDHDVSGGASKNNAGSAYIFTRTGSTWSQQAKIVASDRFERDDFGRSVSIDGDTAIVGARFEDDDVSGGASKNNAGSAYIFTRTGNAWSQQAKIIASDRAVSDSFGYSVFIDGNTAIVGAYLEDHDVSGGAFQTNAGSAYIFTRTGSTWSQQAKIVASDRASNDYFGHSVSIDGGIAMIGAYNEDHDVSGGASKNNAGSAYAFTFPTQGLCDNTVRNGCMLGVVNDAAIVDTATHYRWRCGGANGGGDSGACQFSKATIPGNEGYCAIVNKVTGREVHRFDVDGSAVSVSGSDLVVRDTVYDLQCQYKKFTADGLFDKWQSISPPSVVVKVLPRNVSERNVSGSVGLPVFSETNAAVSVTIPPSAAMVYVYRLDVSSLRQVTPNSLYKIFVDRDAVELSDSETINALKARLFESAVQSRVVVVGSGSGSITRSALTDKSLVAVARTVDGAWSQQVIYSFLVAGSCDNGVRNGCSAGFFNDSAEPDTATEYRWRCDGTRGGENSGQCSILKSSVVVGSCDNSVRNGCSSGTLNDAVESDTATEYRWRCDGAGGEKNSVQCSIAKPVIGSCNNSVRNGCSTGVANDAAESDTATEYRWRCDGAGGEKNSGQCSILKSSVFAGSCNNSVRNGCSSGTLNDAAESDTASEYRWRCDGSGGGQNSGQCSILKSSVVVGSCDNSVRNGCSTGVANDAAESDTATEYRWRCDGAGGGVRSGVCKRNKPIDGGWSKWAPLSGAKTCGDAFVQTRSCTNPAPAHGGKVCSGSSSRQDVGTQCSSGKICKDKKCVVSSISCSANNASFRRWGSNGTCYAIGARATIPAGVVGGRHTIQANVGTGRAVFECTDSGWTEVSSTCS